jgi:hypothetical protein
VRAVSCARHAILALIGLYLAVAATPCPIPREAPVGSAVYAARATHRAGSLVRVPRAGGCAHEAEGAGAARLEARCPCGCGDAAPAPDGRGAAPAIPSASRALVERVDPWDAAPTRVVSYELPVRGIDHVPIAI